MTLNSHTPAGPLPEKWDHFRLASPLVSPANRRNYTIVVVGTGLAGAAAAASLAELGYTIKSFCIQDSPRRAHSIAAQGGINAAKNYSNDGDSVLRLFHDTMKGGDFRSREANVYRLAQISNAIIDQCVAQGVPFTREYGGHLANRSFGGTQVSRTFYARGQTGQQLLLGAYGALMRQVNAGRVTMHPRTEIMDLVVIDGQAKGVITRNLITGAINAQVADAVVLATGGYGNVYFLSTNAMASNVTASWRAYKRGACFANPCFVQIHPTCIPVHGAYQSKLTLMSESLRNDGRLWVPKISGDLRSPNQIAEAERDYFLENKYPSFGNLAPRDVASRNVKEQCDLGQGVGGAGRAVYLDLSEAIKRQGEAQVTRKYGNLFAMYHKITGVDPRHEPMQIYPAVHYTMGGLWVDYALMSNLPGLFVIGEANFSDHGANRLGASALMQGLADGYFVIPATIAPFLAASSPGSINDTHPACNEAIDTVTTRINRLLAIKGSRTVDDFHRQLGLLLWDACGMARNEQGLTAALEAIPRLREEFWQNVKVPGQGEGLNQSLERAGRVADFLEFGELLVRDALLRKESCGCHLREESQTAEHEAERDDANFAYVAAWQHNGATDEPTLRKEPLTFENVQPSQRSYK